MCRHNWYPDPAGGEGRCRQGFRQGQAGMGGEVPVWTRIGWRSPRRRKWGRCAASIDRPRCERASLRTAVGDEVDGARGGVLVGVLVAVLVRRARRCVGPAYSSRCWSACWLVYPVAVLVGVLKFEIMYRSRCWSACWSAC